MTVWWSTWWLEKENLVPIFKNGRKQDPGNSWAVSLTSPSGMIMEQILMEDVQRHTEDREVIQDSQNGVIKGEYNQRIFKNKKICIIKHQLFKIFSLLINF